MSDDGNENPDEAEFRDPYAYDSEDEYEDEQQLPLEEEFVENIHLKALEEHAEHEEKFGHLRDLELHEELPNVARPDKKKKGKQYKLGNVLETTYGMENIFENLGSNFESTPWTVPSTKKANTFKLEHVYLGGETKLKKVKTTGHQIGDDLGSGTALYFYFVKRFIYCFIFMTIVSLPAILLCYEGSRIRDNDKDILTLYQFTIGNIGTNVTFNDKNMNDMNINSTVILSNLGGIEIGMVEVSYTLMVTEILHCIIFLFTLRALHLKVKHWRVLKDEGDRGEVTLGDYAAVIRDIPRDTSTIEIINHFNNLYPLDKPDWRGRPPLYQAEAVKHCDFTQQQETVGTWIAECVVHRKIGHYIRAFREKQYLMEQLYRHRAEMKMYSNDTPNARGPRPSKYLKAEKKMLKIGKKIDKLSIKLAKTTWDRTFLKKRKKGTSGIKESKVAVIDDDKEHVGWTEDDELNAFLKSEGVFDDPERPIDENDIHDDNDADIENQKEEVKLEDLPESEVEDMPPPKNTEEEIERLDAVASFVVFQYSESMARCIEDYRRYDSWQYNYCYPEALLFKGVKIRVDKSPEVHEVNWQNLEIPSSTKWYSKLRTNLLVMFLLLIALVLSAGVAGWTYQNDDTNGAIYISIITILIVNVFLRSIIYKVVRYEYHDSIDEEQTAVLIKCFISMSMNLSFVSLISNIHYPSLGTMLGPLSNLGVFQGGFTDFTVTWYAKVGSSLILLLFLESFAQLFEQSYDYHCYKPYIRCCQYSSIDDQSSHRVAMQYDLDRLEVGPFFSTTMNLARLSSLLCFIMMYSPGIPIMTPIALIIFYIYFKHDKLLLLRYYMKPDKIGEGPLRKVLDFMPFLVMLRLSIACWMYSNPHILPTSSEVKLPMYQVDPSMTKSYTDLLEEQGNNYADYDIIKRITKQHVFPLFLILILIILFWIIRKFWKSLPFYWTIKFLECIKNSICGKPNHVFVDKFGYVRGWDLLQLEDELRQEMCPFTGGYYYFLMDKEEYKQKKDESGCCSKKLIAPDDIELSEEEMNEGWEISDLWDQYKIKTKLFQRAISINGIARPKGDPKRTYEIIGENNLNSFRLDYIPAYKLSLMGLREGTTALLEYQSTLRKATHEHDPPSAKHMFEALAEKENIVEKYHRDKVKNLKKKKGNKFAEDDDVASVNSDNKWGGSDADETHMDDFVPDLEVVEDDDLESYKHLI